MTTRIGELQNLNALIPLTWWVITRSTTGGISAGDGGIWRYISGTPYTPLIDSSYNPGTGQYTRVYVPVNSARLDATHQLDVRIEFKKTYNTWIMTYYLEIWNLYNHLNPVGISYEADSQNKLVQKVETLYGMIPFIGMTAEY